MPLSTVLGTSSSPQTSGPKDCGFSFLSNFSFKLKFIPSYHQVVLLMTKLGVIVSDLSYRRRARALEVTDVFRSSCPPR